MRESKEDINVRKQIIWQFYQDWKKKRTPLKKNFFHRQRIPSPVPPPKFTFLLKKNSLFFLRIKKKPIFAV